LQFVVLAIAAFASIATSRKKWHVDAQIPPHDKGTTRIAFVEASAEPQVMLDNGERPRLLPGYFTGMWSGTARYLIPAERTLTVVQLRGVCGGGMFCGKSDECEPPGTFVKVLSLKPVATWRKEIETPLLTTEVRYPDATRFPLVATHPVRVEVTSSRLRPSAYFEAGKVHVNWPWDERDQQGPKQPVEWSLRIIMEDLCPEATPCDPPANAKLELGQPEQGRWGTGS